MGLFQVRDNAIETTVGNMIMADLIRPEEVKRYMTLLTDMSDECLAIALLNSRIALDSHLGDVNLN